MNNDIDEILGSIERVNNEYTDDIKRYWRLTGSQDQFEIFVRNPIEKFKTIMPDVPGEQWKDLVEKYNPAAMEGEFMNQFMSHFSHEELKEILKLYDENPILKKAASLGPVMFRETMDLGNKWAQKFATLFADKVKYWKECGYIDGELLPPV